MNAESQLLSATERVAETLATRADEVDVSGRIPAQNLDLLADAGLYGLRAPPSVSGLGEMSLPMIHRVVETIASGCLSTAFVWVQHHASVRAAAARAESVGTHWLARLASGQLRAGVAIGAAVRPGPDTLRAREQADGSYVLSGRAHWITGWRYIDVVYAAAAVGHDDLVWVWLDASESDALSVRRLELSAVNATDTVQAEFAEVTVPPERVVNRMPLRQWQDTDVQMLRSNGSLALGVARRCAMLTGDKALWQQLERCRDGLDEAEPHQLPAARAAASDLAVRAAALTVVYQGAISALAHQTAARLVREAALLSVFGSRPAIKAELVQLLRR